MTWLLPGARRHCKAKRCGNVDSVETGSTGEGKAQEGNKIPTLDSKPDRPSRRGKAVTFVYSVAHSLCLLQMFSSLSVPGS